MKRYLRELIPGLVAISLALQAAEPWSDDRLTVVSGLELWYDASHQNAGRATQQLPPLSSGNAVDYLIDGSGQAHHLVQQRREARPNFHQEFNGALLSFDGKDDALTASGLGRMLTNVTVFIAAAPASNEGNFRAFFALSQAGRNDYTTGLNFDLGPQATAQLSYLNAEGSGFGGATQLLRGLGVPFRGWHIFALECQTGSIRLFVDGKAQGVRDRTDLPIRADEFVLGARHYSNTGEPPFTQGFFHG